MRRWNGWGDQSTTYPLPPGAWEFLAIVPGSGFSLPDASLEQVLAACPDSRLSRRAESLLSACSITRDPLDRLMHARGQSLPDWVALRSGQITCFPDGIAYPTNEEQVQSLFRFASSSGTILIPYGGGTSVVGHINPLAGDAPVLTVDLSRMNRLVRLDHTSHLACFEAGVCGPELESQLNQNGMTLGHYPQSFELSTLGGWVATRSCGQQSYYYGRIEDMFAGGRLLTPRGCLELPSHPASAAGPDLKQVVLGSEGRLGIITEASVRVRPLPKMEVFLAAFFHDWESGANALRQISQAGIRASMLRLSNAIETETTLVLSGKDKLAGWARFGLKGLGYGPERCLMIYGITGENHAAAYVKKQVEDAIRSHRGLPIGKTIGRIWRKSRFHTPYLRNTLWEKGYALDTLETAVPWSLVFPTAYAIQEALEGALQAIGERVLVLTHLSHIYADGASIYTTFLFRRDLSAEESLRRWHALKSAASNAIIAHAGTISHQHGVGLDHVPYLTSEKGALGMGVLEAIRSCLDPDDLMNPGKLVYAARS